MKRETYIKITESIRENPHRMRLTNFTNRLLTGFVFFLYPLFLLLLYLEKNPFLARAVMVPAVSFALITLLRRVINAPRPYEKFGLPPVLEKDTPGKSFPSRHVFSVFMIASTVFYVHPDAGLLLGIIGCVLAFIRVIGGVHEPRDVIAGALAGILCGYIGYFVL